MSLEVCPFCGKSYKRLKSHLPYCKAAKPRPLHHERLESPPSGRLEADSSKMKGKKKMTPLSEKASPEVPGKNRQTSTLSKPKKKSIHTTIEVAKSSQISPGLDSAPQSLETVPLIATSTKSKYKNYLPEESQKPQSASKKKQIKSAQKETMDITKDMPRITLQHVGSTLGRAKTSRPVFHIESTQTNTKSSPDLSPTSTSTVKPKESRHLQKDDLYGSKATPIRPPLLPNLRTSKVVFQQTELTSMLTGCLSNLQSKPGDTLATIERRKDNSSGRSLGQVTLRELPEWMACRMPRRPGHAVEIMQRGWHWYYRKYIDVRKGGVGGLGMLLAGYCVLSYVWSYPHLKHERWRKYH
ncbi:uncharacterized protein si:dkey-21c1.4 isoform X1 [Hippocampus zosterae]|uniref:uncharacterized protein si:dkey-21c1.4 isoform X1 n=1 Tax=Hippocampus zosterae TaxID=109293 RepID=UPI00223D99C0|nr:uncharacterized protein si:dkey-21c1.4 isoform X1 [Hippocampus zosterae]